MPICNGVTAVHESNPRCYLTVLVPRIDEKLTVLLASQSSYEKQKTTYNASAKNVDFAKPIKILIATMPEQFWTATVQREIPPQMIITAGR
jgi:hypothetical protein